MRKGDGERKGEKGRRTGDGKRISLLFTVSHRLLLSCRLFDVRRRFLPSLCLTRKFVFTKVDATFCFLSPSLTLSPSLPLTLSFFLSFYVFRLIFFFS